MGDKIEKELGDGSLFNCDIKYVHEKTKMGTAGSVKNAQRYLEDQNFLVVGGDHVTDLNLLEFFREHTLKKSLITIGLISIDEPSEYGIADLDVQYRITRFKEKPAPGEIFSNLASTGIYSCNPELFDMIPSEQTYDFAKDLFPKILSEGKLIHGWLARGNWSDVGNPASLRLAERWKLTELKSSSIAGDLAIKGAQILGPVHLGGSISLGYNSRIIGPVAIGSGTTIQENVLIGPYTSIGEHCNIMNKTRIFSASIYNGVVIGRNCTISGSIIDNSTVIGDRCNIENDTVIGPRVVIRNDVIVHSKTRIWPEVVIPENSVIKEYYLNEDFDNKCDGS